MHIKYNRNEKNVVLCVDGSQDGCKDPITHIMAQIPGYFVSFLLKEIKHGVEKHSSENILREVDSCVDQLKQQNISTVGLISDNEAKMLLLRRTFYNKYHNDNVATPGDPPHAIHLVVKDVLDLYKPLVEKAQVVSKKFKNTRYSWCIR